MDVKQVLIFILFLVPAWTCKINRCCDEQEVREAAERKLRNHFPQTPDPSPAVTDTAASCPVELYRHQPPEELRQRSLSPWRYVLVTKEDHFPSTYAEAQCLCLGCIVIQEKNNGSPVVRESHDYNSVPIMQSRVFLKRERCEDGKTYHLKPVSVNVAVGCTCTRVNTSS